MDLSEDGSKFEETKYFIPTSRRRCNFTTIIAVVSSVLAAILLFTVAALLDHSHPSINYVPAITDNVQVGGWPLVEAGGNVIVDCGGTPAEAKDRGCVWDLMSFSWTHPACYNKNESETFLAEYGPWKWYENVDNKPGAEVLDESDLPYMSMVWTQEHYHIAHCTYILKLLHLAVSLSAPISKFRSMLMHFSLGNERASGHGRRDWHVSHGSLRESFLRPRTSCL